MVPMMQAISAIRRHDFSQFYSTKPKKTANKKYTVEFRQKALELWAKLGTASAAAKQLKISDSTIRSFKYYQSQKSSK